MSRRSLIVLSSALVVSGLCYCRNPHDPHARYLAEAYEQIDDHALFEPSDQALVEGAMRGMVDVLRQRGDLHSGYSSPDDAERFLAEIRQEFGGVGVRIGFRGEPPRLTVVGPPEPDTPASRAGVRAGDRIDAIDGAPTDELDLDRALDMMRGPVGEAVTLTLSRGPGPATASETLALVREEIEVPSVIGDRRLATGEWRYRLEDAPRVALLRLTSFGNKTHRELRSLLPRLIEEGVLAFVIDLRGNPGGALDIAIDICELFLEPGLPIVETRGRGGRLVSRYSSGGGPYADVPLAVLMDGESASAAEILAACLQDNHRAVVIGERSYGKGTVQQLLRTESGRTLLRLTVASYWRPNGANIQRMPDAGEGDEWGVRPDPGFTLPLTEEERTAWRLGRAERDRTPVNVEEGDVEEGDAEVGDANEIDGTEVDAAQTIAAREGARTKPNAAEGDGSTDSSWRDPVLNRAVTHLLGELGGA